MSSIFDSGSGLSRFLSSDIGGRLTNAFTSATENIVGGLVKTKPQIKTSNGQQIAPPVVYQNNPQAGGLMNSLGFGTGQTPNYLMIGGIVAILGLIIFLVMKK